MIPEPLSTDILRVLPANDGWVRIKLTDSLTNQAVVVATPPGTWRNKDMARKVLLIMVFAAANSLRREQCR